MSWKLTDKHFILTNPQELRSWYNYISNSDYGIKISHLGDAYSTTIKEPRTVVTNYDFFTPNKGRFVYIKDSDTIWSPSFYPVEESLDSYKCLHAPGYTQFDSIKNDVRVCHSIFLPQKGTFEIGLINIKNHSNRVKKISVTPEVEFLLYDSFGVDPVYYSWYTNSSYEKDTNSLIFKKLQGGADTVTGFFTSTLSPSFYDASFFAFKGNGSQRKPESVINGQLKNSTSGGDPYIGAFQFDLELKPGEEREFAIFLGVDKNNIQLIKKDFPTTDEVKKEFTIVKEDWLKKINKAEIEQLDDSIFKNYLKTFFPYQIYQQSEGLVRIPFRGYRDVAQDAMSLSYYNPKGAKDIILTMCTKQFDNGRCLRQWNTGGGFNDERDFRDLAFWLPIAVERYIQNTGDKGILDIKMKYFQSETEESVYSHCIKGINYSLQIGDHGLVKMGVGDWNDALSGLGLEGGSVWLNQFAYYALEKLEILDNLTVENHNLNINSLKDTLYKGVMEYWTGEWFGRGISDKGVKLGLEDRIFLLPQAWFTISGMGKRDPEKASIALDNMVKKLSTPNGLMICDPGWDEPDETVGNLSALAPGLAENFAVYNHASLYGVYALLMANKNSEGMDFLKRALPMYKDYTQTRSEPFVLVNYYNGGYYKDKEGNGGIPWLTGTVCWLALGLFDFIIPKKLKIEE
ncbi:hypothetical protein EW093_02605 [Thiospirochaeta perfilievii]|uniref:Glycosyl transferase n=1 Tax=Thiospirochaeta perfilievii TaxID=252967 RepID=A0A5C1QAE7_9SPIO|nr:amylo-alpha-1,6-glucosidase [Thiospirochaeta perfilievii]QEN03634.1 hypothetical protein EW093_02605 [Thiospirochaeta perfilievii]